VSGHRACSTLAVDFPAFRIARSTAQIFLPHEEVPRDVADPREGPGRQPVRVGAGRAPAEVPEFHLLVEKRRERLAQSGINAIGLRLGLGYVFAPSAFKQVRVPVPPREAARLTVANASDQVLHGPGRSSFSWLDIMRLTGVTGLRLQDHTRVRPHTSRQDAARAGLPNP
jgi:hypothetical protein